MADDNTPDYSLKRLRDFCLHIHEENMAILLKTALPDFPVHVVDEFFTGPKLNKPGGPDDREWTDLVRLIFIAFAPEGSEPARLRGKPIPRYKREYPFDPNRTDADEPGVLTLYPTEHTTPILAEIVAALGVTTLSITTKAWLSCYLTDPFDLQKLSVSFGDRWSSETWTPIPGLQSDLSEVLSVLPESLESLSLDLSPKLPFSGESLGHLKCLKRLHLKVASLPKGIDFSENSSIESLGLDIANGGDGVLKGFSQLNSLAYLGVECHVGSVSLEPIGPLLSQSLINLKLSGVAYLSEELTGRAPDACTLSRVAGLRDISLSAGRVDPEKSWEGITFSEMPDLLSVQVESGATRLRVMSCPKVSELRGTLTCDRPVDLEMSSCPLLSVADVVFANGADDIVLDDLPALVELTLTSPKVGSATSSTYHDSGFNETSAAFFLRKSGLVRAPLFKGEWKELSIIEFVDNPRLESLEGIEVLPDLAEIRIRKLPSMKGILPTDSSAKLPKVTWLRAENVSLPAPAGFEVMPNLTKLDLISCSLGGLKGVESLECLSTVDLSSSLIPSIAPLAALPVLKSVRVSGCSGLKPKPPHVLLEGPELVSELARAAGPNHPIAKNLPSEELTKLVQLIGEGQRSDVSQAMSLLSALVPEDKEKILAGMRIDPETGWIKLPYLTKIKDEEAMGIPQIRIVQGIGGARATALLAEVTDIDVNGGDKPKPGTLKFGLNKEYSKNDAVLEEFDSLGALPDLPNVTSISVSYVSRFSLSGLEKYPKLTDLHFWHVDHLEGVEVIRECKGLQRLALTGVTFDDLSSLGSHPDIRRLEVVTRFKSLEGITNFPSLKTLRTKTCEDITALLTLAAERNAAVSCSSYSDSSFCGEVIVFELTPRE